MRHFNDPYRRDVRTSQPTAASFVALPLGQRSVTVAVPITRIPSQRSTCVPGATAGPPAARCRPPRPARRAPGAVGRTRLLVGTDSADSHDDRSAASVTLPRPLRPVATGDHPAVLRLLVDRHHDLTAAQTRAVCRVHAPLYLLIGGGWPFGSAPGQRCARPAPPITWPSAGMWPTNSSPTSIASVGPADEVLAVLPPGGG